MKKLPFTGLFITLILYIMACVTEPADPNGMHEIRPLTYEEELLLKSSNEFSFDLLRMLNKNHPDENILFSSLGVGNGVGMSLNILEIKPKEELKNFLKISEVRDIEVNKAYYELGRMLNYIDLGVRFENGNSLWINHTQEFNLHTSDKIMAYYDADVNYLNFENPKNIKRINQWVENRTFGKIHTVMDTLLPSDRSYIINVLYFDISRALPFEQVNRESVIFNTIEGDRIYCDGIGLYYGTYKRLLHDDFVLFDIPLGKGHFFLTMIIPNKFDDLHKLIDKLSPAILKTYLDQTIVTSDDLLVPDFRINSEIRLKSLFPEFGLTGPLSVIEGYYYAQNLFISDFIHKTQLTLGKDSEHVSQEAEIIANTPDYIVDKPFIFIVREKFTEAMVFTGKLVEPLHIAEE
jgi:serpin B